MWGRTITRLSTWLWAAAVVCCTAALAETPVLLDRVRPFDLPVGLDRIYGGGADLVVGTSQAERLVVLIDARDGRVLARQDLGGVPHSAATAAVPSAPGMVSVAVVIAQEGGGFALRLFAANAARGFVAADATKGGLAKALRDPGVSFLPATVEKGRPGTALVIWDRADPPGSGQILVLRGGAGRPVAPDDQPQHMIPIGSPEWMLALHPPAGRATVIDALTGARHDNVLIENLGDGPPEQLALFVPAEVHGGTGDALIANGSSGQLIALTVSPGYPPLLDPPLRIGLNALRGDRPEGFVPWIAADRAQSLIVVGASGSPSILILRRFRGGIETLASASLVMPVRDGVTLQGPRPIDREHFALLGADGRQLLVLDLQELGVSFQESLPMPEPPPAVTALPPPPLPGGALEPRPMLDPADTRQVQRVLGALGYPVGSIDGIMGQRTTAAIRAFQYDRKLETTGLLDDATVAKLTEGLPVGRKSALDRAVKEYAAFLAGFPDARALATRILAPEPSQEDPNHPCFGLNDLPPPQLWPNSVKVVQLLRRLEADLGTRVHIISAYRTPAYNRCSNYEPASEHQNFGAIDIRPADGPPTDEGYLRLQTALEQLQAKGLTTVRLYCCLNGLHVEPLIGAWHAAIASYPARESGCRLARDDADEFARLLAGTPLRGREVMVLRMPASSVYTVTIDTGNDKAAARNAADLIRALSKKSIDRRTGKDAFVIQGTGLATDTDCLHTRVIN